MQRDFTVKCYEDFCNLVQPLSDTKWQSIRDWFGDRFFGLKHLLADWGLLDYTDKMDVYYKELLDRENTSKEHVTQVFEGISDQDNSFADINIDHLGYFKNYLKGFRTQLQEMSRRTFEGSQSKALSARFSCDEIHYSLGYALAQLQYYSLPAPEHQFTPSTFSQISQADKEAFVNRCDSLCPDLAKAVDALFSDPDWTDQEKLDVKFMIYNAQEPYRTIFFKNTLRCSAVVFQPGSEDSDGVDNSCYSPLTATVYLEDLDSNLRDNERAPYNTVFHEYGHAVDNNTRIKRWNYLSGAFWVDGDNLQKCIVEDTRKYVNAKIDRMCEEGYQCLSKEQQLLLKDEDIRNIVLSSLNLTDKPYPADESGTDTPPSEDDSSPEKLYPAYGGSVKELPEHLRIYSNLIQSSMSDDLRGETNCAASDVYGGVTNNAIGSAYGHKGDKYVFYWFDEDRAATKNQAAELWAEFYAAQMTGDEEALASIQKFFPTAYPMLEEMARQMAEA